MTSQRVRVTRLPDDAPNDWEALLEPGERLLWSGAPGQGLRWTRKDWILVPVTTFWTGLVGALLLRDLSEPVGSPDSSLLKFAIAGALILLGVYLTVARFFWDAHRRARSRYALTDRRGLIAVTAGDKRLTSFPIAADLQVKIEKPAGTVWLLGKTEAMLTPRGDPNPRPTMRRARMRHYRHRLGFAFIGLEEAEKVKDLALAAAADQE